MVVVNKRRINKKLWREVSFCEILYNVSGCVYYWNYDRKLCRGFIKKLKRKLLFGLEILCLSIFKE